MRETLLARRLTWFSHSRHQTSSTILVIDISVRMLLCNTNKASNPYQYNCQDCHPLEYSYVKEKERINGKYYPHIISTIQSRKHHTEAKKTGNNALLCPTVIWESSMSTTCSATVPCPHCAGDKFSNAQSTILHCTDRLAKLRSKSKRCLFYYSTYSASLVERRRSVIF